MRPLSRQYCNTRPCCGQHLSRPPSTRTPRLSPRTNRPAVTPPQQINQSRKGNPSTTAHSQTTHFGTLHSPSMVYIYQVTYTELRQWPSREALCHGMPWHERRASRELSMVTRRGPSLCRYRCRLLPAGIPKGHDGNAELKKRRLQLWEATQMHELIGRILGQHHTEQQNRDQRPRPPQTEEQKGKRACALTARGSISKAMKGLIGGAVAGTAELRQLWTAALSPRSAGQSTHATDVEQAQAARAAWMEEDTKKLEPP